MTKVRPVNANQIPDELLNDKNLNEQIRLLPPNYNFEVHKTIWRIRCLKARRGSSLSSSSLCLSDPSFSVGMQMPEGLFIFASTIADILKKFVFQLNLMIQLFVQIQKK